MKKDSAPPTSRRPTSATLPAAPRYRCRCRGCDACRAYESRGAAASAGWVFVELLTGQHVAYIILCPACVVKATWLKAVMAAAGLR